jgi:hypothetical protein
MPPLDSPEMKEWLSEIDFDNIPDVSPTGLGGCANATNAMAVQNGGEDGACWWTCGGWCVSVVRNLVGDLLTGLFFSTARVPPTSRTARGRKTGVLRSVRLCVDPSCLYMI